MSDDPRTRGTTSTVERRTVVRTAAWTVPVIAASAQAPAFAASCNSYSGVLNPADPTQYTRASKFNATGTIPLQSPGGTVTVDFTATRTQYVLDPLNLTTKAAPTSNQNVASIELRNQFETVDTNTAANNQTLTLTFSRTVNLSFTLCDLDNSANHRDAVAIEGAAFTYSMVMPNGNTTQVQGVGTVANPFRVVGTVNYDNDIQQQGNVAVSMAAVTSFSIRYWNTINAPAGPTGTQSIFLRGLTISGTCP